MKIASSKYHSIWLYHHKNEDITYYIVHKINGKTTWIKVGRKSEGVTEKKAFNFKNSIMLKKRLGLDISQKNYKFLTFQEVANEYFNSSEAKNKSNKKYKLMYKKHIKPTFGNITVNNLSKNQIYELQVKKKEIGLSDSTIVIIVKLIKRIIGFAIADELIAFNPFINIKLPKISNSRLRYLSVYEINRLFEMVKSDKLLNLFVRLALGTGARANSILSITKKDINIELKTITLHDFKRNNTYIGYLDNDTFLLVNKHIKKIGVNSKLVVYKYQKVYTKLTKIFDIFNSELDKRDRANRVVIHTLRHTFASHLAIGGTTIQKIQKLLNHKDIKQTLEYAKLSPDSGRSDVQNLYEIKKTKV